MLSHIVALGALTPLLANSLVLPSPPTPNCSAFAERAHLSPLHGTVLNATYYPVNSLNITNLSNNVSLCGIYASISYGGNDSLIFATWLLERLQYENRFMAVGGSGMAGTIDLDNILTQLNSGIGFAVAGGNSGHLASLNNGGSGAPEVYLPYLHNDAEVEAWIHNAISLFTPAAKELVATYYEQRARYSYYDGCSTGGAQGFALAQYHPDLFDGLVAGSPGNWYSHLALSFLWNGQKTASNASQIPQALLNFTSEAILDACDLNDGVADRLLENPLDCHFDINSLACNATSYGSASNLSTCLTPAQLAATKAIYAGPVRADNGSQLYPGFSFGSEISWAAQEGSLANAFSIPILQNLVYNNLSYNIDTFNWASDVADLDARAGKHIDEMSPNLTSFKSHGGKMLVTQGWSDPLNAALWPIQHLEQLQDFFGGDISDFFNLFMVPGGGHCGVAKYYPQVPATYHTVAKLVQWVERDEKPDEVLSTGAPDGSNVTRKLCPWPANAKYIQGPEDDWNSYVCE